MSAAYSIYSGAAHAELYSVMQGWRDSGLPHSHGMLLERWPDREAVWTSVIIAAGFVMIPAFEALSRLDWSAQEAGRRKHAQKQGTRATDESAPVVLVGRHRNEHP